MEVHSLMTGLRARLNSQQVIEYLALFVCVCVFAKLASLETVTNSRALCRLIASYWFILSGHYIGPFFAVVPFTAPLLAVFSVGSVHHLRSRVNVKWANSVSCELQMHLHRPSLYIWQCFPDHLFLHSTCRIY